MKCYVVDAFTDSVFRGNPAAVCILDEWLSDALMLEIAREHNLSETAFAVRNGEQYELRWFTPCSEVDLCGHATLATAYVLMRFVVPDWEAVSFQTKSGLLTVKKNQDLYELDFPLRKPQMTDVTEQMAQAIGTTILEAYVFGEYLLLLLEDEQQVQNMEPNFDLLRALADHAVIVTAKGDTLDFVSRFFAPNVGIPEDPVTGSAHTILIPFWAEKLGKNRMTAKQLSRRGGILNCENCGDRVKISGEAALYSINEIFLPVSSESH